MKRLKIFSWGTLAIVLWFTPFYLEDTISHHAWYRFPLSGFILFVCFLSALRALHLTMDD